MIINKTNPKNLPIVVSAMGVVFLQEPSKNKQILVVEANGEIMPPKGRVEEEDHDIVATAIREVREEAGVALTRENYLGQVGSFGFEFSKHNVFKKIEIQFFQINQRQAIKMEKGFTWGGWLDIDNALNTLAHIEPKQAIKKCLEILQN